MSETGYQPDFLGDIHVVDLPAVTAEHIGDVLSAEGLRDEFLFDYLHYTVAMSQSTRQALFSASNADFSNPNGVGRSFRFDSRIDPHQQLGNTYYKDLSGIENPYDRGHLTRRDAIAWGANQREANKASRDSCFYPNVSLQHKNFNRDEWHALESAIENSNMDANERFNVFVGPIFSGIDRFVSPSPGLEPGRVPAAFWKVIAYVGKSSNSIEANAFVVFQDCEAVMSARQVLGNDNLDPFALYQSSTALIEEMTGLEFPEVLGEMNPIIFTPGPTAAALGVQTPQLKRVEPLEADHGIVFTQ